jgi:hypothetical protein
VQSGKDANPDIPILKQAKAEYAKLQQMRAVLFTKSQQNFPCLIHL